LEDSGLLEKIILREVCTHYRIHKGRVLFAFSREEGDSQAVETCTQCLVNSKLELLFSQGAKHKRVASVLTKSIQSFSLFA